MFTLCTTCQRHVLADAPSCPFCSKKKGLLSRRAVGAMAIASLGIAACGPSEPPAVSPTVDVPEGDPPEEQPLVQEQETPPEPGLTEEETDEVVEQETPDEPEEPEEPDTVDVPFDRPMVARYGIAPRPVSTATPQPPPTKPQRPVARYGVAPRRP